MHVSEVERLRHFPRSKPRPLLSRRRWPPRDRKRSTIPVSEGIYCQIDVNAIASPHDRYRHLNGFVVSVPRLTERRAFDKLRRCHAHLVGDAVANVRQVDLQVSPDRGWTVRPPATSMDQVREEFCLCSIMPAPPDCDGCRYSGRERRCDRGSYSNCSPKIHVSSIPQSPGPKNLRPRARPGMPPRSARRSLNRSPGCHRWL